MITLNRKSLPLTITRNGIEHVLLSPIERIGLSAERMGISVIQVNVRPVAPYKKKHIDEAMYAGRISRINRDNMVQEYHRKYKEKNYYYFYDKNFVHMEKQIRHSA